MAEYLAPAVYVEEVDTGTKPIEGVSTSTTGLVGVTERGPVDVPILVTSYGEYRRWFGDAIRFADFGPSSYLPHSVEGFFVNGGKRAYVTRVIDTALAQRARFALFYNAGGTLGETVLLRATTEFTGSAANPPPIVVLSGNNLTAGVAGDWVRVGDGSASEYRQVMTMNAETVVVPLHLPLSRAHPNNSVVQQFPLPAIGAGFDVGAAGTAAGASMVAIEGTVANVNALVAAQAGADQLVRVGGVTGEFRFIRQITNVVDSTAGNRTARLTLDAPLAIAHAGGANSLQRVGAPALGPMVNLQPASAAGASIAFVVNRGGAFNNRADLVIIEPGVAGAQEVRRIGELHEMTLATGVPLGAPAGTVVSEATLVPSNLIQVQAAPAPTVTTFGVNDIGRLSLNQRVLVGGTPRTISSITPGAAPGGTLAVTPALGAAPAAGTFVVPVRQLQAAAAAGAPFIALDNRLGLAAGDVLRITSGADEEYVMVDGVPDPAAPGVKPDPGNVLLGAPLARAYDIATTEVVQLNAPGTGALQPTVAALNVPVGGTRLLLADGFGYTVPPPPGARFVSLRTPEGEVSFHRVAALAATATPQMIELDTFLGRPHPVGASVVERSALLDVEALDVGEWGDRLRISVENEPSGLASTRLTAVILPPNIVRVASLAGFEAGTVLEMRSPDGTQVVGGFLKVLSVDRAAGRVVLQGGLDLAQQAAIGALPPGQTMRLVSREFRLRVELLRRPDSLVPARDTTVIQQEDYRNLSMDPRHSRFAPRVIGLIGGPLRRVDRRSEGDSWLIRVGDADAAHANDIRIGPEALIDVLPDGRERPARHPLTGGDDSIGTLTPAHYIGVDDPNPELRTGLNSLRNVEEISIVGVPGATSPAIQNALINHCELTRYRFAVLDGNPPPADSMSDIQTQRAQFDTKYAALYHPWLLIPNPFPPAPGPVPDYPIPPSGHMLGIYARTDIERGVHKAPANEVVRGVIGLQRILNKEQHDILNPYPVNINVIRDFRTNNRGIRVYGGRVITSDSDWKYVNVRRLLIFIEASIDRGLQWVVFEPNAEPLWARVRRAIANFLTLVWRNGGLEGTKVEEAFFVKCDRTTMTQTDIDQGRLICLVGVAPVKPAEFVIVRIGLWTAHADD